MRDWARRIIPRDIGWLRKIKVIDIRMDIDDKIVKI